MDYRCYFLTSDGRFVAVEEFTAETIAEAITHARAVLAESNYPACELWQGAQLVHKEVREARSAV